MTAMRSSLNTTNKHSSEEQALLASNPDDYMNEQHRQFFRTRLMAIREELLTAEQETTFHLKEQESTPDPLDRATVEENLTLELRLRDRERRLLKKVEQALQRIDDGTYGWCAETGEPIGLARLLSRPTATLCLEAQQRRERIQQVFGQ
jgi:DnaK suppressor protein